MGIENELSAAEIAAADGVILAVDIPVQGASASPACRWWR